MLLTIKIRNKHTTDCYVISRVVRRCVWYEFNINWSLSQTCHLSIDDKFSKLKMMCVMYWLVFIKYSNPSMFHNCKGSEILSPSEKLSIKIYLFLSIFWKMEPVSRTLKHKSQHKTMVREAHCCLLKTCFIRTFRKCFVQKLRLVSYGIFRPTKWNEVQIPDFK